MVIACGRRIRIIRYPLSGFRKMAGIYKYLRSLVPLFRVMGLAYAKKVQERGIIKYKPYVAIISVIQCLLECSFILYLLRNLFKKMSKTITTIYSFDALELFAAIMFTAQVIASKIKSIEFRKEAVESIDCINDVDILFKQLGIKASYKKITFISKLVVYAGFVLFPIFLILVYSDDALFFCLFLQIWRITSINMFSLLVFLLYTKYKQLNTFLKLYIRENEEGIPWTDTSLEPLDVINTVANIYDKLCISGKKWNSVHHVALSINLLFYGIGMTLFSIAYYTSPEEMGPMIPAVFYLCCEFFYVLSASQMTRVECHKIMININEMSCCYIDNDLWRARNSFLLQTLHQRVNFMMLHVFPMDFSMAIKIGGVVISVLVLTIQIRSLQEVK